MAITTAIELYRGEAARIVFTMETVTDITGWTIEFTMARSKNIATKLIERTCVHDDDANGVFAAVLLVADTDINPGRYYWDVWRTDTGEERVLGIGTFTILPDVREPNQ